MLQELSMAEQRCRTVLEVPVGLPVVEGRRKLSGGPADGAPVDGALPG
jgi:hypothetical protein